jgi:hypothetical protein
MKYFFGILFVIGLPWVSLAQQTIDQIITHNRLSREYILYVPASYTGSEPVPLLLNFHALVSNAQQQMAFGDFRSVAVTAGFLVAYQNGTEVEFGDRGWNIGPGEVDDVGFIGALPIHLMQNIISTGKKCMPPAYPWKERPGRSLRRESRIPLHCAVRLSLLPSFRILIPKTALLSNIIVHEGGENNVTVEHLKIIGGTHARAKTIPIHSILKRRIALGWSNPGTSACGFTTLPAD